MMRSTPREERGAVLIAALVLLVVLTLLGLSAMQNTTLEERMAGNLRSENAAFQAAETALRAGESWIGALFVKPVADANGSNGVWLLDAPDADADDDQAWWRQRDASWWSSYADAVGTSTLAYGPDLNLDVLPRYLIEERGVVRDTLNLGQQNDFVGRPYYQITARGTGMGGQPAVILRSTYSRRY